MAFVNQHQMIGEERYYIVHYLRSELSKMVDCDGNNPLADALCLGITNPDQGSK